MMSNAAESFEQSSNQYFDNLTKLFSDLYLQSVSSTKSFFPCRYHKDLILTIPLFQL